MARPTQPLRDEHKGLLLHIEELRKTADMIGEASREAEQRELEASFSFLSRHLGPHAQAEERVLYPTVEKLMGASEATATMKMDHAEIIRLTQELGSLLKAEPDRDASRDKSLRRILYGLYTLVGVHFAKEEEVYLPLLDAKMSEEEVRTMYRAMEQVAHEAMRQAA